MKTDIGQDFELWKMRERHDRPKPYEVRWRVGTMEKSKSYKTKALAQQRERALMAAARAGEHFSEETGEPVSWARSSETVYAAAVAYARHAWGSTDSGNTRRTVRDNAVRLILASIDDKAARKHPAPADMARVRSAVGDYGCEFTIDSDASSLAERVVPRPAPADAAACLAWVAKVSRPLAEVAKSADAALELLERSCVRLHQRRGASATVAPDTKRRRRGVLSSILGHAVQRGVLASNPLHGLTMRRPRSSDAVSPRHVPDWDQARRLLAAVETSRNKNDRFLWAFFVTAYMAGTRPGETRAIRAQDIIWPEDVTDSDAAPGWGVLVASGSRTEVASRYTDGGERGEVRGLKGRSSKDLRMVPLAPEAVAALRWHLDAYGTAPDGRLFWHATGGDPWGVVSGKVYRRTWARARKTALTPAERELGVAQRPYDLRHGCASYLIADGVPTPEIARRLGHSVEVLLTVYVHWFRQQEHDANKLLSRAFAERGPLTGQGAQAPASVTRIPRSAA
ncbi:tyrosine-type recombinase/integrase [Streptomonospora sp. S1-112]|uniref:Tyrosine-type recombinase/integrase n=1 Tax=Streptomonospora mangrovi TaxID=2883123 RepID=A0A9X3SCL0_9ACTN|nr:tyrosine-type recombinase/integrase [Streptomonospora mangrovi]MDA0562872.1 tyrosine-type recombinase/integrase [Streptomonospora mangrovi]